jgi:hypothetical protein
MLKNVEARHGRNEFSVVGQFDVEAAFTPPRAEVNSTLPGKLTHCRVFQRAVRYTKNELQCVLLD